MNEFRLRSTGAIVNESELRAAINIMLPALLDTKTLNGIGADPVFPAPSPELPAGQVATRNGAVYINGLWFYSWTIESMGSTELAVLLADEIAVHNEPLLAALKEIDARSIRPLREANRAKLDELEAQAAAIRTNLKKA